MACMAIWHVFVLKNSARERGDLSISDGVGYVSINV